MTWCMKIRACNLYQLHLGTQVDKGCLQFGFTQKGHQILEMSNKSLICI